MEVDSSYIEPQEMSPQEMIDKSLDKSKLLLHLLSKKNTSEGEQPNFLSITDDNGNTLAESSLTPEKVLGLGETALVLSGRSSDGAPLALKIFFQAAIGEKEKFKRILQNEHDVLTDLDHPAFAGYFGMGNIKLSETMSVPVLVKELVPKRLQDVLSAGPLSPEDTIKLVSTLSDGLDYLNKQKGLLVTDLGLKNIGERDNGDWVITDLGYLAKPGSKDTVGVDDSYGAPELLNIHNDETKNRLATPASEVFSLALLSWTCLAGKKIDPMDRQFNSTVDIIKKNNLSDEVFNVILKGISSKPEDRYQTPDEFVLALEKAIK